MRDLGLLDRDGDDRVGGGKHDRARIAEVARTGAIHRFDPIVIGGSRNGSEIIEQCDGHIAGDA